MELIPGWQNAYKFTSVIMAAATGLFEILYANVDAIGALLTPGQNATLVSVAAALTIFFRIVKQVFPVTAEVKKDMVDTAKEVPVKVG